MIAWLKRLNRVLPGLLLEILLYGGLVELIGVWLVQDKLAFTIGLWIGIVLAMAMAIHMAVVILDSLDLVVEKKAQTHTTVFSLLRYVVILLVFGAMLYFDFGNVLAAFVGVMGLKVAAYLWPYFEKIFKL